jgi:ATP-dependent Clp protease ATP-binding subunit ClpC
LAEEIITSKIEIGDLIVMDYEENATELTVKVEKTEKPV